MKNFTWIIFVLIIAILIGGYFIISNNLSQEGLVRINVTNPQSTENIIAPSSQLENSTPKSIIIGSKATDQPQETESIAPAPTTITPSPSADLPTTGSFPGNSTSNLAYGGLIATDTKWDYFLSAVNYADINSGALYRMKVDGTSLQKLTNDYAGSINIVGDWLYYTQWDKKYNSNGIFRIKKNGTQKEQIFKGPVTSMIIAGDSIYFVNAADDYSVYKIDTSGNNLKFIVKNGAPIQYEDNYLYYSVFPDIYRINLDTLSNPEKVAVNVRNYIVYKDNIYYFQNGQQRKLLKKAGGVSESTVINDNTESNFYILNDIIFFMTKTPGDIYMMDLDGKNKASLPKDKFGDIRRIEGVVGNMVYYRVIFDASEAGNDKMACMNLDGSINELLSDKITTIK